jgi:hypothetical protein
MDTILQVLEQEPVSPRKLNPLTPPDLDTICQKCLEKSSLRRYHSARELAEELGRFLNREPILARRASWTRRAWNLGRRRPWILTGIASLLVLMLLGLSYYLWAENRGDLAKVFWLSTERAFFSAQSFGATRWAFIASLR